MKHPKQNPPIILWSNSHKNYHRFTTDIEKLRTWQKSMIFHWEGKAWKGAIRSLWQNCWKTCKGMKIRQKCKCSNLHKKYNPIRGYSLSFPYKKRAKNWARSRYRMKTVKNCCNIANRSDNWSASFKNKAKKWKAWTLIATTHLPHPKKHNFSMI